MRSPPGGTDLVELAAEFVPGAVVAELYSRDPDPPVGNVLEIVLGTLRWLLVVLRVKRNHQSRHVLVAVTPDRVAVLAATTSDGASVKVRGIEDVWMRDDVTAGVDDELGVHVVAISGKRVDVRLYPFVQSPAAREIARFLKYR